MGLGDWLRKVFRRDEPADAGPTLLTEEEPRELESDDTFIAPAKRDVVEEVRSRPLSDGVSHAMTILVTLDDRVAAQALVRWLREAAEGTALGLDDRAKVAEFFFSRGDEATGVKALKVVADDDGAAGLSARMRLGDLAGQNGNVAEALDWYEAVLAVDLDYPAARERHARYKRPAKAGDAGATLLAPDAGVGLGRYALTRELGRGGAGAVYLADDRKLTRPVAVKIYHPSARADRGARLRAEAQVAAGVKSAHVVRVLDLQPSLGALVMEHCDGGALRARITHRDYTRDDAVRWVAELTRALAATHDAGWVHRDVKPGNVLLRHDGSVALTDFGLARKVGSSAPAMEGTAGYVPPEVVRGGRVEATADVYALGAIARELGLGDDAALGPLVAQCVSSDAAARPVDASAVLEALL